MMMLIVSYVVNDRLVSGVNNHGKGSALSSSGIALIILFIIFTCGNITWIVYQFVLFSGCGRNIAMMVCTCFVAVILYVIVLFRTRQDASMFTSSLVVAYCLYLQWSAFSSDENS